MLGRGNFDMYSKDFLKRLLFLIFFYVYSEKEEVYIKIKKEMCILCKKNMCNFKL